MNHLQSSHFSTFALLSNYRRTWEAPVPHQPPQEGNASEPTPPRNSEGLSKAQPRFQRRTRRRYPPAPAETPLPRWPLRTAAPAPPHRGHGAARGRWGTGAPIPPPGMAARAAAAAASGSAPAPPLLSPLLPFPSPASAAKAAAPAPTYAGPARPGHPAGRLRGPAAPPDTPDKGGHLVGCPCASPPAPTRSRRLLTQDLLAAVGMRLVRVDPLEILPGHSVPHGGSAKFPHRLRARCAEPPLPHFIARRRRPGATPPAPPSPPIGHRRLLGALPPPLRPLAAGWGRPWGARGAGQERPSGRRKTALRAGQEQLSDRTGAALRAGKEEPSGRTGAALRARKEQRSSFLNPRSRELLSWSDPVLPGPCLKVLNYNSKRLKQSLRFLPFLC